MIAIAPFLLLICFSVLSCQELGPFIQTSNFSGYCKDPVQPSSLITAPLPGNAFYVLTPSELKKIQLNEQGGVQVDGTELAGPSNQRVVVEGNSSRVYISSDNEIVAFDGDLNLLGTYQLAEYVEDFAVLNNHIYALSERSLWIINFASANSAHLVRELPFPADKPGHHIVIDNSTAYVLDNVVMPVYIHWVDISTPNNPQLETLQWEGVNPYLVDQAVDDDTWYVLERSNSLYGIGQALTALRADPPLEEIGLYGLPVWTRSEDNSPIDPRFFYIQQIQPLPDRHMLMAGTQLTLEGYPEGNLIVGSFALSGSERSALVGHLCLADDANDSSPIASEMLAHGSTIYLGGAQGVYVIDASDPSNLVPVGLIKTENRVDSMAWME